MIICPWIWKGLIIIGLGMTFGGLLLLIEAKIYRYTDPDTGKRTWAQSTFVEKEWINRIGWFLTFAGYVLQVIGVILS